MKAFFKAIFKKLWAILVRIFYLAPYLRLVEPDEDESVDKKEDQATEQEDAE